MIDNTKFMCYTYSNFKKYYFQKDLRHFYFLMENLPPTTLKWLYEPKTT